VRADVRRGAAMTSEDEVVAAVCRHLERGGYEILQRCRTSERGIDIVARSPAGDVVHVEAKGRRATTRAANVSASHSTAHSAQSMWQARSTQRRPARTPNEHARRWRSPTPDCTVSLSAAFDTHWRDLKSRSFGLLPITVCRCSGVSTNLVISYCGL
jgi:Holliday junction resolvase-like predicted endonuclease